MFCSISNTIPKEPVVSPTGYVFEKELILKYLDETGGACPITGQSLSSSELIELKSQTLMEPRQPTTMSIPGLLESLHSEWQSLILETHSLRLLLEQARTDLQHYSVKHEEALRVIQRLQMEKDALIAKKSEPSSSSPSVSLDSLLQSFTSSLTSTTEKMLNYRKSFRKQKPSSSPSAADFSKSSSLIVSLEENRETFSIGNTEKLVSIINKNIVQIGNFTTGFETIDTLQSKMIDFHSPVIPSMSCFIITTVESIKVYVQKDEDFLNSLNSQIFGTFTSSSIFPDCNYCVAVSDEDVAIYDLLTGQKLSVLTLPTGKVAQISRVHPDGNLVFIGDSNGDILVYDVKTLQLLSTLSDQNNRSKIKKMSVSENGTLLYVLFSNGNLVTFNLRKPNDQPILISNQIVDVMSSKFGYLLTFCSSEYVFIMDTKPFNPENRVVLPIDVEEIGSINNVLFTNDEKLIAIGSKSVAILTV
ncbi:hypothetical protein RCL1_006512 [Eukaryota sp. TZLM3-RCL]